MDKFVWSVRLAKTRSQAAEAITKGKKESSKNENTTNYSIKYKKKSKEIDGKLGYHPKGIHMSESEIT